MIRVLWPLFLVGACAFSEDHFVDRTPALYCAQYKACDLDAFLRRWPGGTPDCREDASVVVKERASGSTVAECRFEEDGAVACLNALAADDCAELTADGYLEDCIYPAWDCVFVTQP